MSHQIDTASCRDWETASKLEWCLTNGIGGYAMGTVSGANTRRYHGLLVSATEPPAVRTVLLANLEAYVNFGPEQVGLSTNQYVRAIHPQGYTTLSSFEVGEEAVWTHQVSGNTVVKTVRAHQGVNAVTITYENRGNAPCQLTLRPLVCRKFYHDNFRLADFYPEFLVFPDNRTVVSHQGVSLYLEHPGAERATSTGWYYRFENERELDRGLDPLDDLFCPCELRYLLTPGDKAVIVASSDENVAPITTPLRTGVSDTVGQLKEAATKFVVHTEDRASLIAGYPWFTDWGRDTMIALPGCLIHTGRVEDARNVLTSFAMQMRQGLIPNRFVDRGEKTDYNTVDATLWFGHAIRLTLLAEWDEPFATKAMAWMREVIHWHVQGTRFGIQVDAEDGLLRQGEAGAQLTWMDAKIGDWVVTPR
ncbi:MAG: glycogen debranching enzyme N-terminal domain-containing protein, partial [Armatimonadota bacterium]